MHDRYRQGRPAVRPAAFLLAAFASTAAATPFSFTPESYEAKPGLIPLEGWVVFYAADAPLSMVSMTRSEIPEYAVPAGKVKGRSCQYGLQVPLSLSPLATKFSGGVGDGSFWEAINKIREINPKIIGIYDVKVDQHIVSILRIYRRVCTVVSAYGLMMRETEPKTDLQNEKVPPHLLER